MPTGNPKLPPSDQVFNWSIFGFSCPFCFSMVVPEHPKMLRSPVILHRVTKYRAILPCHMSNYHGNKSQVTVTVSHIGMTGFTGSHYPRRDSMWRSFPQVKISMPRYLNKPYSPANNWARCPEPRWNTINRGSTASDTDTLTITLCFVSDLGAMQSYNLKYVL